MSDINWAGLVNRTNPFAEFSEGMARGTGIRQERERTNLFAQKQAFEMEEAQRERAKEEAATARQASVGAAIGKGDYAGARTAAGGDLATLKAIGELDEQQRKVVQERNGVLAAYLTQLEGQDPSTAKAQIMQDAPALMELGFTQEQIAGFQPTPQNLAMMKARALGLEKMLAETDRLRDDKRAEATAAETARANAERERQGKARLGLSADANRRGWASFNERKKAGGFGTPGVGGVVIPDDAVEIDP